MSRTNNFTRFPLLNKLSLRVYLVYILLSLIFLPAIKAGLVVHFTDFVKHILERPEDAITHSYGSDSIHWAAGLLTYFPYLIWDLNRTAWGIYMLVIHLLNAALLYHVAIKLLDWFGVPKNQEIAFFTGAMFLVFPYQVEAVVWEASIHYSLCVGFMSLALLSVSKLQKKTPGWSWLFFALSLLTFELAFTLPAIIFILYFIVDENSEWVERMWNSLVKSGPYFIIWGGYLLLNKIIEGDFIGQYGPRVHLRADLAEMGGNLSKYFFKNLLFVRHWTHSWKEEIFSQLSGISGLFLLLILFMITLFLFRRRPSQKKFIIFLSLGFTLAILPVLNLYFSFLLLGENDRYGYWAFFFFAFLLSYISYQIGTWPGRIITSSFLIISIILTFQLSTYWGESEQLRKSFLNHLPEDITQPVILLNNPDNYKGLWLFRSVGSGSGVSNALKYIENKEVSTTIHEVYQYNMTGMTDGCSASWIDERKLKVELNQWGCWFWNDGIGGIPLDNKMYSTTIDGHVYYLDFKVDPGQYLIFVQDGVEWKKVEPRNID